MTEAIYFTAIAGLLLYFVLYVDRAEKKNKGLAVGKDGRLVSKVNNQEEYYH